MALLRLGSAAVCVTLVLLSGCSSHEDPPVDNSSTTSVSPTAALTTTAASTTTQATSTASNSPTRRPAQTFEVAIQGNAFVNATVTLQEGDSVRWVHRDGTTPHSVKSDNASFDSNGGLPCPGPGCMTSLAQATYEHKFEAAGTWPYRCEVHPSMKGTVVVEKA